MREGGSSLHTPFHIFKILETQKIYIKMYKRTVKIIDIFNQVLGGRSDKRKEKGMHTSLASEDSYQKRATLKHSHIHYLIFFPQCPLEVSIHHNPHSMEGEETRFGILMTYLQPHCQIQSLDSLPCGRLYPRTLELKFEF